MSSETLRLIEKTASDMFAAEGAAARAALAGGAWPERLWQAFDESGLARAALPEEAGGAGLAAGLAVLRAAGRHAAPIPVAETMMGNCLCYAADVAPPPGLLAVWAPPLKGLGIEAKVNDESGTDTIPRVPWARFGSGSVLIVGADRLKLTVATPTDVVEGYNMAGEPRDDVTIRPEDRNAQWLPSEVDGFTLMAFFRAAQLRGAMEQVLDMSLRHARDRVQFGRPLVRFQAIQHHLAEIAGEAAAAGAAVDAAAQTQNAFGFAAAKARASQAAGTVARLAHQVHGAMGYTAEHDLHIWTRRLWAWRDECGNEADWWQYLGEFIAHHMYRGCEALWPTMVAAAADDVRTA